MKILTIGDIITYKEKDYEILEVLSDGNLIIGNGNICDDEVSPHDIRIKARIENI